jgi:hypothetical protein
MKRLQTSGPVRRASSVVHRYRRLYDPASNTTFSFIQHFLSVRFHFPEHHYAVERSSRLICRSVCVCRAQFSSPFLHDLPARQAAQSDDSMIDACNMPSELICIMHFQNLRTDHCVQELPAPGHNAKQICDSETFNTINLIAADHGWFCHHSSACGVASLTQCRE